MASPEEGNILQNLADNSHRQDNSNIGTYGSVDGCSSDVNRRTGSSEHCHVFRVGLSGLSGPEGSKQCRKKYITKDSITIFTRSLNKCNPYE